MATLVSPGVSVTVTDESFFVPVSAPTVPLLFVATEDEKLQPDGVSAAEGTFESDVIRTVTSLQQSTELYGIPRFLEDATTGNQFHGDARNEYGLFALNQFLGVGNLAYVIRANVNLNDDLDDLRTLWDRKFQESSVIMQSLTQEFINEFNTTNGLIASDPGYKQTVTESEFLSLADEATEGVFSLFSFEGVKDDYFDDHSIPGSATSGSQVANYGGRLAIGLAEIEVFAGSPAPGSPIGSPAVPLTITSNTSTGLANDSTTYQMNVVVDGGSPIINVSIQGQHAQTYGLLINQINLDLGTVATAEIFDGKILIWSSTSGASSSVVVTDVSLLAALGPNINNSYVGLSGDHPTGLANNATNYTATAVIDGTPLAIQITGSAAQTFTDLVSELNTDLNTFATASINSAGNIIVTSDTTGIGSTVNLSDGTLFAATYWFTTFNAATPGQDADSGGLAIYENGYDQPSTGTYAGLEGIAAAWTSGSVVADEWTPVEASNTIVSAADQFKYTVEFLNGTSLGANDAARRVAITTALASTINSNTDIRADDFEYNLILCPGYHELVDEMLALAVDINEEALVIGDTPVDQDPDGITNPATGWAGTTARQLSVNLAYYYPWAFASNLDGKNVTVAPSGVALRTYAFSDDVSFLWFAPAGTRRGVVTGVSDFGYVDGTLGGATDFISVQLNQGERDALYQYSATGGINPLVFFPGRGFLVWGQKTSTGLTASALDRVNVSRLVKYIKRQLRKGALPFVFEPNDQLTRDNLKAVVDAFLGDLIVKRGLFDFASVCDESNNTPDRIDRNELYCDVAIKPVKAAEFIFIPIRIVSTGTEI